MVENNFLETTFTSRRTIRFTSDIEVYKKTGNSIYMKYLSDLDEDLNPCWLSGKPRKYIEVNSSNDFVEYIDVSLVPRYDSRWECAKYPQLVSSHEDRLQLEIVESISLGLYSSLKLKTFSLRRGKFFAIWGHFPGYFITKL